MTIGILSPPLIAAAVTVPLSATAFRKWTRSVVSWGLAISTKSIPLSVVFDGSSSAFKRSFTSPAISHYREQDALVGLGFDQCVFDTDLELSGVRRLTGRNDRHLVDLDLIR